MVDWLSSANSFQVWPFRFHFIASESVLFPEGSASNTLRGAFGSIFRKLVCIPKCSDAKSCEIAHQCPYALAFEPRQGWARSQGPSGFTDWPRPFVFRALHLDGCSFSRGQNFYFDLILFEPPANVLPYFVLVFRQLAAAGVGPSRSRASLSKVEDISNGALLYDGQKLISKDLPGREIRFDKPSAPVYQITVRFLTPTQLKSGGQLVSHPEFAVLIARLRDRISNLRTMYQGGPLNLDFESIGRAAEHVRIVRSSLRHVQAERFSSRTGQRHSIGGFTGSVDYQGELSAFLLPFLQAGEWTGVGRQTVWGKGAIQILGEVLVPSSTYVL